MPDSTWLYLCGATAVGKSDVALALAEKVAGEIVSVDSMQVYRGLDLGTAKPSASERARVPHHLLDVADPSEKFDAARFVTLATAAAQDIEGRGGVPIFCGGTGFYFKALAEGLGAAPPSDPALRASLQAAPLPELLAELAQRDPVLHAGIDRQNPRRVVRALEVIRLTGRPFSDQRAPWNQPATPAAANITTIGFTRDPSEHQRRIDARVDRMFADGLVAETTGLLREGLAANTTASQAIGYRQVIEHLAGARSLAETIALVKLRTRQYAKRQMTWFRAQSVAEWIDLSAGVTPGSIAERLARTVFRR